MSGCRVWLGHGSRLEFSMEVRSGLFLYLEPRAHPSPTTTKFLLILRRHSFSYPMSSSHNTYLFWYKLSLCSPDWPPTLRSAD